MYNVFPKTHLIIHKQMHRELMEKKVLVKLAPGSVLCEVRE
jgi:hypothetical protein